MQGLPNRQKIVGQLNTSANHIALTDEKMLDILQRIEQINNVPLKED